ncbi:unnamed protein product, partial [Staurois parvus]
FLDLHCNHFVPSANLYILRGGLTIRAVGHKPRALSLVGGPMKCPSTFFIRLCGLWQGHRGPRSPIARGPHELSVCP